MLGVLDFFKRCFQFVLDLYKNFEIIDGVSMFDFFIVIFVAGGILTLLIRAFGASGISSAGASTFSAYRSQEDYKARESQRASEKAHRESYDYYASNRSRREAYAKRYNKAHK